MKKSDFIFWGVLGAIALFYLLKGNDIYREHYKNLEETREKLVKEQEAKTQ